MSDTSNEFENLQTLLKLKRHETPPPGYFNNFSTVVINQIEREARLSAKVQNSWLHKCLSFLETNPIAAGIFGMGVCGLLALGFTFSQERSSSDFASTGNLTLDLPTGGSAGSFSQNKRVSSGFISASLSPVFGSSLTGSAGSEFDRLSFQPVNFTIGR